MDRLERSEKSGRIGGVPAPAERQALTAPQTAALEGLRSRALAIREASAERVAACLRQAGLPPVVSADVLNRIRSFGSVNVHFHPDRYLPEGHTVAEGLLREGRYYSQFETQVTNGSPTAYRGGDRDVWEEALFGGAYQTEGATGRERPKYGALNLMNYPDGASPRFGSCYLRLRPHVLERCTFTFGDSYSFPTSFGTSNAFDAVLAALLEAVRDSGEALGTPHMTVLELVNRLLRLGSPDERIPGKGRALDDYVEAQIHGDIELSADAEGLVADPSFQGTETGERLAELCAVHRIALTWHEGFRLAAADVPADFRGPAIPPFARRVEPFAAAGGLIEAAAIGRAAASLHADPGKWRDLGTPESVYQYLKQLWHVLVRFG